VTTEAGSRTLGLEGLAEPIGFEVAQPTIQAEAVAEPSMHRFELVVVILCFGAAVLLGFMK
jgi:hypothetical protein